MAEGIVASLQGDWQAVVQAVRSVFGGADYYLLSEDEDATKQLHFYKNVSLDNNQRMPRGRAFNNDSEVRWRKSGKSRFTITFLSESFQAPVGFEMSSAKWEAFRRAQKLHGQWSETAKDWVEVAVPGISGHYKKLFDSFDFSIFHLPLKLNVVDYFLDGCAQMTRFCGVEEDARYRR